MEPGCILKAKAFWCHYYEILKATTLQRFSGQLGVTFHKHQGNIYLTDTAILIDGDETLQITLSSIRELYLGCDEVFRPEYLKSFGYFTKPLRVEFYIDPAKCNQIYFFINQGIINKNIKWYDTLVAMLS